MDPVAFRASLSSEFSTTTPHPALVHVILLIASSYFPPSPHLGQLSSQFLTQTLEAISSGIEQAERLLDIVQASCLLASYFYSQDRTLEGYYHSTSAARLVTTIGLDKLPASVVSDALQEKVTTLCQVFAVDKGWAVITGLPSLMPDDELWLALILASPQPAHSSPDVRISFINIMSYIFNLSVPTEREPSGSSSRRSAKGDTCFTAWCLLVV